MGLGVMEETQASVEEASQGLQTCSPWLWGGVGGVLGLAAPCLPSLG